MSIVVYVEGGGLTRRDQARLRKAFEELFKKLHVRNVAVICAGARSAAFRDFKNEKRPNALLLVDSEGPVNARSPWEHVATHPADRWPRPPNVTDEQLHLMVQAMEAWLAADPEALAAYYGSAFRKDKLPRSSNLEKVPKDDLEKALEAATKDAKTKGQYAKSHAFELVEKIDPAKVRRRCPMWAERFFRALENASK